MRRDHQPARIRQIGAWTRRGSVVGLMAFLLPALFILAALTVNASYMQLTRTELRIANDAATRSAGRAFSEYQDVDSATAAGQATAALNNVAGAPLQLRTGDADNEIEFGTTTQNNAGKFLFTKVNTADVRNGTTVASAVRVNGDRNSASLSGTVDFILPRFSGGDTQFSVDSTATAVQVDRDISLVLDRSGSMSWITWPSGKSPWYTSTMNAGVAAGKLYISGGYYYYSSGVNSTSYKKWAWEEHYQLGLYQSPWEDLKDSVETFLDVLDDTHTSEQVSIASYSTYGSLDLYLESNYTSVMNEVNTLYASGMTAIGDGMNQGITSLLHANARPYAAKTMVVLTDGLYNYGSNPVTVATNLVSTYNLTIHTVTFGAGADQSLMQQIATIGGGNHYHADSGAELQDVFEEIANNLPVLITE